MPYIIPETMPQDWLGPALESLDIPADHDLAGIVDADMRRTYEHMIDVLKVPKAMAQLRIACLAAAQRHRKPA